LIINNHGGSRKDVETPQRGVSTATTKPQPHRLAWKSNSLGSIINQFKSICTKRIHKIQPAISKIWQAGYYDRIIRNEAEFNRIQSYILTNLENWEKDEIFR
jgi:REP element-mobilizing transposase RayT